MRRMIVLGVFCISATVLLAQTQNDKARETVPPKIAAAFIPLNVNTGLWQMTQTVSWTGLSPQMAAMMKQMSPTMTYKSCVKPKDLIVNPWANPHDKCAWTVLNSTGSDMELRGTCTLENGGTMDVHGKIHAVDSEHGTGSMDIATTAMGQAMHGHATYTGKWIGATCPAVMN